MKNFVSIILMSLALPAISVQANQQSEVKKSQKPNILFIIIDDMGWKDISCAGSAYYETPNIDKLASEGIQFTNAYSTSPVCTPARGSIFTGKFTPRTKLTAVFRGDSGPDDRLYDRSKYRGEKEQKFEARNRHALPKDEFIIPQALSEGGYTTGFFGKWHIGECPGYYPDDRGFDVAKGYRVNQHGSSRSHWMKDFAKAAANLDHADKDAYVADVLTDECVNFIKENKDKGKPWFAVLSHYLVHLPIQPKPEKLEKYRNKPTTDQTNPGYAAMVESVDVSVGRLMDTLKNLELKEDTLVIFTSDNGGLAPRYTSNYPLMGGKSFPFEAGMKVPFIVRWPGRIQPQISSERIVHTDIYPTLLSAAGLPLRPEQHLDGEDLIPLMTQNTTLKKRPIIHSYPHYTHATGPFHSIILDNWKLIRFYNDWEGAYLLYNLKIDPYEQNDLSKANPEKRDFLASQLSAVLIEMDAEMPIPNPDWDKSRARQSPRFNRRGGINRGHFTLESTLKLAERQRKLLQERLENVDQ